MATTDDCAHRAPDAKYKARRDHDGENMSKFTPSQLRALERERTRVFRQHQREIVEAKNEMYARGLKDGREALQEELRLLLDIRVADVRVS